MPDLDRPSRGAHLEICARLASAASQGKWERPKTRHLGELAAIMVDFILPPNQPIRCRLDLAEPAALVAVHKGDLDLLV